MELKDDRQEAKVKQALTSERFATIFQALDQAADAIRQTAINQLRYEQDANERMTKVEASGQKLSDTVDRYLSARLNGNRQN